MILSSSPLIGDFLMFGSKWLCHLSRHCLPVRHPMRYTCVSCWAMKVQRFVPYWLTSSTIALSSYSNQTINFQKFSVVSIFTYRVVPQLSLTCVFALLNRPAWGCLSSALPHFDAQGSVGHLGVSPSCPSLSPELQGCLGPSIVSIRIKLLFLFLLAFFLVLFTLFFTIAVLVTVFITFIFFIIFIFLRVLLLTHCGSPVLYLSLSTTNVVVIIISTLVVWLLLLLVFEFRVAALLVGRCTSFWGSFLLCICWLRSGGFTLLPVPIHLLQLELRWQCRRSLVLLSCSSLLLVCTWFCRWLGLSSCSLVWLCILLVSFGLLISFGSRWLGRWLLLSLGCLLLLDLDLLCYWSWFLLRISWGFRHDATLLWWSCWLYLKKVIND